MRRKRAPIATRILRVSHFLRIIHSGGASTGTWISRVPRAAFRKPPPAGVEHNPREREGSQMGKREPVPPSDHRGDYPALNLRAG